jgi:hypothetical protein
VIVDGNPASRMQLFLYDHPNRVVYHRIRTDEEGHFQFPGVPPGIYKLTERAAGHPTWRLRVELKPGQNLAMISVHPTAPASGTIFLILRYR